MTDKCPPHQRFTTNWLAASARMLRIGLSDVGGDVFAILDLPGAGYDAKKDAGIFLTCAEKSTNSQLNLPHGNKKHEIEDVCLAPLVLWSRRCCRVVRHFEYYRRGRQTVYTERECAYRYIDTASRITSRKFSQASRKP